MGVRRTLPARRAEAPRSREKQERKSQRRTGTPERGSVLPLLALSLAFVMLSVMFVAGVTDRAVRRARAQSAADAASLAGVVDGRTGAVRLARANEAELVDFQPNRNEVTVVVEFDGVRATARAERRLAPDPRE